MKYLWLFLLLCGFIFLSCKKEADENTPTTYALTINPTNGGSVNTVAGNYAAGTSVELMATPAPNYQFTGWSNGTSDNPLRLVMDRNQSISAYFVKKIVALTITTTGSGTVEQQLLASGKNTTDYVIGSQLRLTAIPLENWRFASWSGEISSNENPIEITLNSTATYVATFEEGSSSETSTQGVVLAATGEGDTYNHITSILAPGYDPIETPDCNHAAFGDHITATYDTILEKQVFQFHIHVTPDNDRCIKFDRQRNEIKTYDKSPENLLGRQGETVTYRWKFKLAEGFQSSPKFTHIHQLKSVGGAFSSMPMYTLTTRKSSPDRLELRYAETDQQITLKQTDLAPLINRWIQVNETLSYQQSGGYSIELRDVITQEVLFTYSNENQINWREGAEFVRPKWGIYRSLVYPDDLRDETLRFADFQIIEP